MELPLEQSCHPNTWPQRTNGRETHGIGWKRPELSSGTVAGDQTDYGEYRVSRGTFGITPYLLYVTSFRLEGRITSKTRNAGSNGFAAHQINSPPARYSHQICRSVVGGVQRHGVAILTSTRIATKNPKWWTMPPRPCLRIASPRPSWKRILCLRVTYRIIHGDSASDDDVYNSNTRMTPREASVQSSTIWTRPGFDKVQQAIDKVAEATDPNSDLNTQEDFVDDLALIWPFVGRRQVRNIKGQKVVRPKEPGTLFFYF
jgi:hypothetical protein